jgi:hypothetical protein
MDNQKQSVSSMIISFFLKKNERYDYQIRREHEELQQQTFQYGDQISSIKKREKKLHTSVERGGEKGSLAPFHYQPL